MAGIRETKRHHVLVNGTALPVFCGRGKCRLEEGREEAGFCERKHGYFDG